MLASRMTVVRQNLKRDVPSHVDRRNRQWGGPVNSGLAESRKTSAAKLSRLNWIADVILA